MPATCSQGEEGIARARCERLHVTAPDPNALNDFPAYCAETGHRLVEARAEGTKFLFVIEKAT